MTSAVLCPEHYKLDAAPRQQFWDIICIRNLHSQLLRAATNTPSGWSLPMGVLCLIMRGATGKEISKPGESDPACGTPD